ncbi:MAG: HD domain-containing phosphohydrolase [Cellvibrio sp.]|jgi:putative two-component system response regulator
MTIDFNPTILVVNDDAPTLNALRQILKNYCQLLYANSSEVGLAVADAEQPDLILLDVMMPQMNGYQICEQLKHSERTRHIPVIFISAFSDAADEAHGFAAGGADYLTKPLNAALVRVRIATHLSLARVDESKRSCLELVQRLGMAAEYKDNETGLHVLRMSHYACVIARAAGLDEAVVEDLFHAAPMHDIGKIGIPDSVLQKTGKLTPDDWAIMREHPVIGARIIGVHADGLLRMAHDIALTHHERWDGSGYPRGLAGEGIPLVGRIVALADVFDALTTQRPHKKAWPLNEAVAYIREQRGKHFDPRLVDIFLEQMPAILEVRERWADKS